MITLKLEPEQCEFLEAALEKACDNEGDGVYLEQYVNILELLRKEQENFYA
jgi:hypothetical protein